MAGRRGSLESANGDGSQFYCSKCRSGTSFDAVPLEFEREGMLCPSCGAVLRYRRGARANPDNSTLTQVAWTTYSAIAVVKALRDHATGENAGPEELQQYDILDRCYKGLVKLHQTVQRKRM